MADMSDISMLLGMLGSSSSENGGEQAEESGNDNSFFGNIDTETLIKLIEVFSSLDEKDKNTELILALKPHLRKENRPKADMAVKMMKLLSVISALGGNNIF